VPRELVWLENSIFPAWGCAACDWILPNAGRTRTDKPPPDAQAAFATHTCTKTRYEPAPDKRKKEHSSGGKCPAT
jgi:hypothetical protein